MTPTDRPWSTLPPALTIGVLSYTFVHLPLSFDFHGVTDVDFSGRLT